MKKILITFITFMILAGCSNSGVKPKDYKYGFRVILTEKNQDFLESKSLDEFKRYYQHSLTVGLSNYDLNLIEESNVKEKFKYDSTGFISLEDYERELSKAWASDETLNFYLYGDEFVKSRYYTHLLGFHDESTMVGNKLTSRDDELVLVPVIPIDYFKQNYQGDDLHGDLEEFLNLPASEVNNDGYGQYYLVPVNQANERGNSSPSEWLPLYRPLKYCKEFKYYAAKYSVAVDIEDIYVCDKLDNESFKEMDIHPGEIEMPDDF